MHGNRDFLLGDGFATRSGVHLLPDSTVIELFGTPTLLLHGDTLCTDDQAYQDFRAMVRDEGWQRDFLARPIQERQAIARQLRETSQQATRQKAEYITDVNTGSVADCMRAAGVRRLIHGHTHRPAVHDFVLDGQPARRIVLGDWYEQGSLLRCDAQGCRLETLTAGEPVRRT
jgi:UDP-2,3-diacylglucosamine hydrolase